MLIQLIIGVGLFGIVMAGIMTFLSYATQSEKSVRSINEFNRLITLAQLALKDSQVCTLNFQTTSLAAATSGVDVKVHFYDKDGNQLEVLTEQGKAHENFFTMDSVKLIPRAQTTDTRYIADLEFQATKIGQSMGTPTLKQSIPIIATTDTMGAVVSCYGNYGAGDVQEIDQKICELLSEGQMFFDPVTKKCKNRYERQCFPGGTTTATCGPGSIELAVASCNVLNVEDTKKDDVITVRKYADGSEGEAHWPKFFFCEAVSELSVKCLVASDVTVNPPGQVCEACCNVDLLALSPPAP